MKNARGGDGQILWHRSSSSLQNSSLKKHYSMRDFKHQNINLLYKEQMTIGQRIADKVASVMGSWTFIISQSILLALWIIANAIALISHWDSSLSVLLNVVLSFQAAFATPVILMSQNRQSEKERLKADQDYKVNLKAEHDVVLLLEKIEAQEQRELQILEHLNVLITRTGRNYYS